MAFTSKWFGQLAVKRPQAHETQRFVPRHLVCPDRSLPPADRSRYRPAENIPASRTPPPLPLLSSNSAKGRSGLPGSLSELLRMLPNTFLHLVGRVYSNDYFGRDAQQSLRSRRQESGEPEAGMDTYSEIVPELVDWMASRSGAILIMSATLPLALLLKEGRTLSFGALAVFAG